MGQSSARKRIILLGATGSIGRSTLSVIDNLPDELCLVAAASGSRWEPMLELVERWRPEAVALADPAAAGALRKALRSGQGGRELPRIYEGGEGLVRMVEETPADTVVGAISGAAGLPASLAAIQTGKDLALANKESMVCAGQLLTEAARSRGRQIIPVDSEHSAIFQCLRAGRPEEVRAVVLTASGGPFRSTPRERLERVTVEEALQHPTWRMGSKITIDSATLMNKALEVIEARWLFDLPREKIRVVIHPQSIIHSMVEYVDGSTICQLGPPDMRVPIQYALTYPARRPLPVARIDLAEVGKLTFEPPDLDRFPSLRMAYQALERGGAAPAVLNGANEAAVDLFLNRKIAFPRIFELVEGALSAHRDGRAGFASGGGEEGRAPALEDVFQADRWARDEVARRCR